MVFHSDLLTVKDIRFLQTSFKPKYVNRKDNLFPAYDFYIKFLKSKLEHALLSVHMAEKIIKKEDSLSLRQKTIQIDYAKAALLWI